MLALLIAEFGAVDFQFHSGPCFVNLIQGNEKKDVSRVSGVVVDGGFGLRAGGNFASASCHRLGGVHRNEA
jgi:hypothetical protein